MTVQTRTQRWCALRHRRSQNPNPAALVTFLRASPPLCSPRCLRAAVATPRAAFGTFVRPSSPSCGPRRLRAAVASFVRPRRLHVALPPHLHTLALAQCFLQGPLLAAALPGCRPLLQSSPRRLIRSSRPTEIFQPPKQGFFSVHDQLQFLGKIFQLFIPVPLVSLCSTCQREKV